MNALVGVRSNALGTLSATPEQRDTVAKSLAARVSALGAVSVPKAAAAAGDNTATREVRQDLDRDAFLQLLVLEMRHQDPLDPTDNSEMLAQLAQFSSLEQMHNLNERFETLAGNLDQLNFISANSLLGRQVSGVSVAGEPVEGVVDTVLMEGSMVYLSIGGELMAMAGVMEIE